MQQSKCAYIVLIMVTYWFTEVIPMSITALIPVVLFPLMGIVSSEDVSKTYFNVSCVSQVDTQVAVNVPFLGDHHGLSG